MRKIARTIAFALLIIGTLGLLVNELVFDWGRAATIFLAVLNVIGLILICFAVGGGGEQDEKTDPGQK
jgi:hypothetical protein